MIVRFDLRPRSVIESSSKKIRYQRLVAAVLLLSFSLVTGITVVYGAMLSTSLRAERARLERVVEESQLENRRLVSQIKTLRAREKIFAGALSLLQKELPSLEFLGALEGALPPTVWLDKVSIKAGTATMSGNAYAENDIVTFARGLSASTVVTFVGLPVTTRSRRDGRDVVRFNLQCGVMDLEKLDQLSRKEVSQR
jgi:Tfp pilus assembly protein PilN